MRFLTGSFSKKRVILFSLLGALVGLTSFTALSFASYILLTPLLLCLLFAGGGLLPLLIGGAFCCVTFSALSGTAGALLAFLALVLPALLTAAAIMNALPYSHQLRISVAGHVGGVLLMLILASVMTGGQLIAALVDTMRQTISAMPDNFQDTLLIFLYPELSPSGTLVTLTSAVRTSYLNDFFQQLNSELSLQALPMLVQSSLFTAGLSSYLPARALYLRGQLREPAFLPVSHWFLPGRLTVGILLTTLASYLLILTGFSGADTAFITMSAILRLVFAGQGIAAMDRMLCTSHSGIVRKTLLIGAVYAFIPTLVTTIGLCSALFGRKGLLHTMRKRGPKA